MLKYYSKIDFVDKVWHANLALLVDTMVTNKCLDIVRCPVKFKYIYILLKIHGARTAFCMVIESKCHRTGTVLGQASYDVWKAPGYSFDRLMPVRTTDDARPDTGRWLAGHRLMIYESLPSVRSDVYLQNIYFTSQYQK